MKFTYREVINFANAANVYLQMHSEETKLVYGLRKVHKQTLNHIREYNDMVEDLRVENCATGEGGIVLRDANNNYQFTKDGLKIFNKATRDLNESSVDIEPFIVTELPEKFEEQFREVFEGFVITKPNQE